jgi:hypothetical protein
MHASRLLISAVTALSVVGVAGLAVAQSTPSAPTTPSVSTTSPSGTTTTVSPAGVTTSTPPPSAAETERLNRERMNMPAPTGGMGTGTTGSADGTTARDAAANRETRAARNDRN